MHTASKQKKINAHNQNNRKTSGRNNTITIRHVPYLNMVITCTVGSRTVFSLVWKWDVSKWCDTRITHRLVGVVVSLVVVLVVL